MEEIYLSAKDVANHIDSKVRTIENWAAAGNIQQNEKGKYGLISAYRYQLEKVNVDLARTRLLLEEKKQELDKSDDELVKKAFEARQRKDIAEADREEAMAALKQLELEVMQGKLVDASEVLDRWKNAIANVKAKLIGIPAKMALELSGLDKPEDIQARLTQVIDEALIELGSS